MSQLSSQTKKISITLPENDWGQVLDGLNERLDSYKRTADYERSGLTDGMIEDGCGLAEALEMIDCYEDIISRIQAQRVAEKNA